MKSNKSALQKTAYYSGITSFLASGACLIFLYLSVDSMGWESTISASLMASAFFFASVGFVLVIIGNCNLPSFKVDNSDS